eukprot:g20949.t1
MAKVGSLEFATGKLGSRLILVLGHTKCGAIYGATKTYLDSTQPGKKAGCALEGLLQDLGTVAEQAAQEMGAEAASDDVAAHAVKVNVFHTINFLLKFSQSIREGVRSGQIQIQGGIYHLETGCVEFLGKSPAQAELLDSAMPLPPSMVASNDADRGVHGVRTGADERMPSDVALKMLKEGNERFAIGAVTASKTSGDMRKALVKYNQAPHSAILGSIAGATQTFQSGSSKAPGCALEGLLQGLASVAKEASDDLGPGAAQEKLVSHAVKVNVFNSMNFLLQFSEPIRDLVSKGDLDIQGGIYHLETGRVEFLGDLFVLRNAGNTCTHAEGSILGSLEFCTGALNTQLIFVLGHTNCGAIKGATATYLAPKDEKKKASQALDVLLNELSSVVSEAQAQCGRKATEDEIAAKAIKLNVFHTINFLLQYSEPIREKVRSGKLEIQGGIYDLKSGQVEFLGQSPMQSKLVKSTSTAAPSLQQKLVLGTLSGALALVLLLLVRRVQKQAPAPVRIALGTIGLIFDRSQIHGPVCKGLKSYVSQMVPGSEATVFEVADKAKVMITYAAPSGKTFSQDRDGKAESKCFDWRRVMSVVIPLLFLAVWYQVAKSLISRENKWTPTRSRRLPREKTTFADVVSRSKVELSEIVEYLNNPSKFKQELSGSKTLYEKNHADSANEMRRGRAASLSPPMDVKKGGRDRVWEGGHTVIDHLSPFYSKYADAASANERIRQAAMFFCVAEGHVEDGDLEEASVASEGCLEIFREENDQKGIRDALRLAVHVLRAKADEAGARNQGERAAAREQLEKAEALAEEELSNYRDAGDDLGQGCMLLSLAEATCAYRGSNKREEALGNCEEARDLFHQVGDAKYEGLAILMLAEVYFRKRNFHAARRASAEAAEIFKGEDDKLCQAMALHMGAATDARAGVLEMAIRLGRKSLKILQEVGTKKQQMASLLALGQFYLMREDARLSLSMGEAATALLQELFVWRMPQCQGVAVGFLVEAYILNNQAHKAIQVCKEALERVRHRFDQKRETVYLLHHLIHALSVYGDIEQAREVSEEALAVADDVGCKRLKAHVWEEMSHAYLLGEQNNDALHAAEVSVQLLKDLGADHDEITTRLQVLTKVLIIQDNYREAYNQIELAKENKSMRSIWYADLQQCQTRWNPRT